MIMLGMFVSVSLCIRLFMFTVSNALLMSKATATVRCESLGLLKPFVIWWQMLFKAVCVEAKMFSIMFVNSVLAMGDRSDMSR